MPAPRALVPLALAAALLVPAVLASSAGAVGTACTASQVTLLSPDRAAFLWTKPTTWASNGSGRILARLEGSTDAFSTLATITGFRTASTRTTTASIPALASGTYTWRVELTPPAGSGAVDYCTGITTFVIARPTAPTVTLGGDKVTSDGWRAVTGGQTAHVAATDSVAGTPYVQFQTADGTWGSELPAPAAIPTTDISAVRAYRRSMVGLTGAVTTTALRSDATAPVTPGVPGASVVLGPSGASVSLTASTDGGSGVARHEQSVVSASGAVSAWTPVASLVATVSSADAGGTLRVRACDKVGNCSDAAEITILAAPVPPPVVHIEAPRITAMAPLGAAGGAARIDVTASRPAHVTFTVMRGTTTIVTTTAWLGSGTTRVRISGGAKAVRDATLTARPAIGSHAGPAVTATISLPAAPRGRKLETGVPSVTRMRAGALAMLYDVDAAVREVVRPSDGAAGLTGAQGARRQEPSTSGLFGRDDEPWMVGKVKLDEIIDMSSDQMVQVLQDAIADSPSHVIGIDEVTTTAADPAAANVVGARAVAPDPQSPGGQFAAALAQLDSPSPYGGTWASRIHVYLAPAMVRAIATGLGPDRNLGRDRRPHFRTYRGVLQGVSHVAGVWIEMYNGLGAKTSVPLTAREWQTVPTAVGAEFRRAGGDMSRLHLLITGSDTYPSGRLPSGCVTPQRCAWALAESTTAGRQLVANGVGGYRLANTARAFLAEWHARLT